MSNTKELTAEQVLFDGYPKFVRALFNRSGDPSKDFTHAALGIVTEISELRQATDKVNRIEELGDLLFYVHALKQVVSDYVDQSQTGQVNEPTKSVPHQAMPSNRVMVDTLCNELLDTAKRWVGYGKAPGHPYAESGRAHMILSLADEDYLGAADREKVALVNIKKLLERYKGMKFNAEHALNRNLNAERRVLENASASALA